MMIRIVMMITSFILANFKSARSLAPVDAAVLKRINVLNIKSSMMTKMRKKTWF